MGKRGIATTTTATGQRDDGGPFDWWGVWRLWPLLTGERGHFEFAAGSDANPYIRAMEGFAQGVGLLPEQVWDEADRPDQFFAHGRPTGAAMPLMWAYAQYIKLFRSVVDGDVFDLIPEVAERYWGRAKCKPLEVWKPNRQPRSVKRGMTLRVQSPERFLLVWTTDEWEETSDTRSTQTRLGIEYVDIPIHADQQAPIRFTFRWVEGDRWDGRDYARGRHIVDGVRPVGSRTGISACWAIGVARLATRRASATATGTGASCVVLSRLDSHGLLDSPPWPFVARPSDGK